MTNDNPPTTLSAIVFTTLTAHDLAARLKTFSCPRVFCGKRELKPMTLLAFTKVAAWIESFWSDTSQRTPSLQGGVVKDPS